MKLEPARFLVPAMLLAVAVIHLLPVAGVLGSERLTALYGLSFSEPSLEILMRHRAVLFGLLGLFLVFAVFRPAFRAVAFVAGFASVLSFLVLAWSVGDYNPQIARVVAADVLALICLSIGLAVHLFARRP